MQHARHPQAERRGIEAARLARSRSLHADELHARLVQKRMEHADGIGAAAHAGHHGIRQFARPLLHLLARLLPDDLLEHPHQRGERMRPRRRAKAVMRGLLLGYPGPQRLIDGVLERARAALHRDDRRPEQTHAHNIGSLPLHIFRAHVHRAAHAQTGRRHSRGHPVMPCAGLRHQRRLAHILGQQRLSQRIIDLVRPGMQQILPLEPELDAQLLGKTRTERQRRGTPRKIAQQVPQLRLKTLRRQDGLHGLFHFQQRRHEQLRHKATAEFAEIALFHSSSRNGSAVA